MSTIILKSSTVAAKVPLPGDLALGEIALNSTDGKIYMKLGTGTVVDIVDHTAPSGSSEVLAQLLTVDGTGSLLDADLLDGQEGTYYLDWANTTNKPDPIITLGGDLTGSVTLTDLASGTLTATLVAENFQDLVGAMVSTNTENGIAVTYNDTTGKLDFNVADPVITLGGDVSGSATMTNLGNVTITTVVANDSHTHTYGNLTGIPATFVPTTENVQDIVGGMIVTNSELGIAVTYNDTTGKLDFNVADSLITLSGDVSGSATMTNLGNVTITTVVANDSHTHTYGNLTSIPTTFEPIVESVQDIVGGMVISNTESGIAVTYNDTTGVLDFNVADSLITLSGDVSGSATMTNLGNVTITTVVADDSHNHIISNVDGLQVALDAKLALTGGTMSGILDMGSLKITNLADGVALSDVVNKGQLDSAQAGLLVKDQCRCATTAALPAVVAAGSGVGKTLTASAVGILTVDGIAMVLNDRVIIKNQVAGADNGIYLMTTEGTAGVAFILTRATDYDGNPSGEVKTGTFAFVDAGTANVKSGWTLTEVGLTGGGSPAIAVVDTDTLSFAQFQGLPAYTGGTNITVVGDVISVSPQGTGSGLDADLLDGSTKSSTASNSTVVQRTGSGYIYANYFNTTPNQISDGSMTQLCGESGNDGFIRHATASVVRTFLNVENGATADQTKGDIDALGINAATLDSVDSLSFLRGDQNDSYSGTLTSTGTADVLVFDGGHGKLTIHDGAGNMILRHGSTYSAGDKYVTTGSGATKLVFTSDGSAGTITLSSAATGTAGAAVTYGGSLQVNSTGVALTGNLTTTGLIDTRDIAADGVTLDALNTSDPVITLTGDVTGAGTMTNLGSVSFATIVANDSHTHATQYLAVGSSTQNVYAGRVYFDNSHYIDTVTGDYGSLQVNGAGTGSWEGFSIDGRAVFMHDGTASTGIYNDVNNQWLFKATHAAAAEIYYAGATKIQTTAGGANISGNLTVTGTVDGVDIAALAASDPVITLTGDVTGAGTMTNLGSVSFATVVANDSHTHATQYLGLTATAANSQLLDNYNSAEASTISTVAVRNASGDINARLFRSEYDTTNASIGFIMTQVDTATNNYMRPSTMAQVRSSLNVANGAIANLVEDTTPQLGGMLDVNGQAIGDGTLELLTFTEVALAVNQVNIANAATAGAPTISTVGSDFDVPLIINPQNDGVVFFPTGVVIGDDLTTTPRGTLHVVTGGGTGTIPPVGGYNDVVFDGGSNHNVVNVYSGNTLTSNLYFGSPANNAASKVTWDYTNLDFTIGTAIAGGDVVFKSGNGVEGMRLTSAGNVTVTGTVDGRDIAADGITLDALNTSDPIITLGGDLSGSGTMTNLGSTTITATVANDSHTHATQYLGLTAKATDSELLDGINGASFLRSDVGATKTSGNLIFNDNVKAAFGSASDMTMYHNNTSATIENLTGVLIIQNKSNSSETWIRNDNSAGAAKHCIVTGGATPLVKLYYDAGIKLETSATGVTVTGTMTGTASAAQYADLAEMYTADADIMPGTVVSFGGTHEITTCLVDMDRKVAGVVSTNPAYLMNAELDGGVALALQGRVPCKVSGIIEKGDMLVSDGKGGARAEADPKMGTVIGKALENSTGDAVIEIVVGRM